MKRRLHLSIYIDPHDLWMGCYWKRMFEISDIADLRKKIVGRYVTTAYLCPFFCFVIRVVFYGKEQSLEG